MKELDNFDWYKFGFYQKNFTAVQEVACSFILKQGWNSNHYCPITEVELIKKKYYDFLMYGKNAWVEPYPKNYLP